MAVIMSGGWVRVLYDGPDLARVQLAVVRNAPTAADWRPAFLDFAAGRRVAQVRPPVGMAGSASVWLREAGGQATQQGTIRL